MERTGFNFPSQNLDDGRWDDAGIKPAGTPSVQRALSQSRGAVCGSVTISVRPRYRCASIVTPSPRLAQGGWRDRYHQFVVPGQLARELGKGFPEVAGQGKRTRKGRGRQILKCI